MLDYALCVLCSVLVCQVFFMSSVCLSLSSVRNIALKPNLRLDTLHRYKNRHNIGLAFGTSLRLIRQLVINTRQKKTLQMIDITYTKHNKP